MLFSVAARVSNESLKWLDWPEYLATAQQLRQEPCQLPEHHASFPFVLR